MKRSDKETVLYGFFRCLPTAEHASRNQKKRIAESPESLYKYDRMLPLAFHRRALLFGQYTGSIVDLPGLASHVAEWITESPGFGIKGKHFH